MIRNRIHKLKYICGILLLLLCFLTGCTGNPGMAGSADKDTQQAAASIEESGSYTSKEDVAAYIHRFGHLPGNFITKKEAKNAGWVSSKGNLDALYDCLTEKEEMEIEVENRALAHDYFLRIWRVLLDAAEENEDLQLIG